MMTVMSVEELFVVFGEMAQDAQFFALSVVCALAAFLIVSLLGSALYTLPLIAAVIFAVWATFQGTFTVWLSAVRYIKVARVEIAALVAISAIIIGAGVGQILHDVVKYMKTLEKKSDLPDSKDKKKYDYDLLQWADETGPLGKKAMLIAIREELEKLYSEVEFK